MVIEDLFVSQRRLRRAAQIPALVLAICNGDRIPPIRLSEVDDGTVQIDDGHHRTVAYILSGRRTLAPGEYLLIQTDSPRRRVGTISDLLANTLASVDSKRIDEFLVFVPQINLGSTFPEVTPAQRVAK